MRVPFLEASSCGAVVSVCDSMNYLTSRSDMELTIKAVHSQLRDGGIFIFDMKTDSFYKDELGNRRSGGQSRKGVLCLAEPLR